MMQWLGERWCSFFFAPRSAAPLGICRILFYGLMASYYALSPELKDRGMLAAIDPVFWMPIELFRWTGLRPLPSATLEIIGWLWVGTLFLCSIGFLTRISTVAAIIPGLYLDGLLYNFGASTHSSALMHFTMIVFAFSRCGDVLSVDRLLAIRRGQATTLVPAGLSGEYTWPIRAVWVVMVLMFFGAGISKLRHAGVAWIFSDTLRILFLRNSYAGYPVATAWGPMLANYPLICWLMAVGALALEVFAPLALFHKWLRAMIVPGLLLLQLGNWFIMGLFFYAWLVCYLFWIPWERLVTASVPATGAHRVNPFPTEASGWRTLSRLWR